MLLKFDDNLQPIYRYISTAKRLSILALTCECQLYNEITLCKFFKVSFAFIYLLLQPLHDNLENLHEPMRVLFVLDVYFLLEHGDSLEFLSISSNITNAYNSFGIWRFRKMTITFQLYMCN